MKIGIFDPYTPKFTEGMRLKWEAQGHEVWRSRYYDPDVVRWADVVWFETCDNNLHTASTGMTGPDHQENWAMSDIDMTGKKVIVRVIDIEAWYGHHNGGNWDLVDDVIFIAPHIRRIVEKDIDFEKHNVRVHEIPCGVDMDAFTLIDRPIGNKIAWVCEKWPTKGIDYMLQLMAELPRDFELHALGPWNDRYAWEKAYQEDFIARNNIKFFDYEHVPDMNEWLEDKDFILSCSKKEAFGYSIAEGMAKGLVPVVHWFYGCEKLWDINRWEKVSDAAYIVEMYATDTNFPRVRFREYLEKRGYTLDKMMERFNEVINA